MKKTHRVGKGKKKLKRTGAMRPQLFLLIPLPRKKKEAD